MGLVDLKSSEKGIDEKMGFGGKKGTKYRRMDSEEEGEEGIHHLGERWREKGNSRKYVYVCALFASLNSILLGYDVGVMSGAIIYIQKDLHITEFEEEVLVGCLSIVSLLGSLSGGRTSDAIGRKWTMGLGAVVFQAGAAIMTFAPSFQILLIGRLLAGIGIGFGAMISAVYIAEISPAISRGTLTSLPEICINLGILLGYVSNYAFSGLSEHINWRIMLGVGILPSVFIGFALFVIPESPRWLVMQKRVKEARSVLLAISENEAEVEERLVEIEEAAGVLHAAKGNEEKAVWRELLSPSPAVARMLAAGCGIQIFQQITGIDATVYYSPTIFSNAGIKSDKEILAATVAVGFTKTMFILVAIFLIDRVGRKPLLNIPSQIASSGLCAWPSRRRVSSGLVSMSFLSVARVISVAGVFFIFSAVSVVSVVFVYVCVPETKGKTLEQIELMFQGGREWQKGELQLGDVEHLIQE
uniref:Major facilitator superfamily (MFS) profile domain-containing protein n=1 Tax=Ananas comosus var. bracteatus TaxID=296719 RepID=A0A6V7QMZ3_ANACO|nr:unnamed protein product [Ananas comosus var. bracteatus]